MRPYERFYRHGYEIFDFDPCGLDLTLKEILEGRIKNGFHLQEKYRSTGDLRPNAIDYSEEFLNVLKKNNVKHLLRSRTLKQLTLYHVQIRVTEATTSYMDWHRDSYFDGDRKVGMTPPTYKIIYYPKYSILPQQRLQVSVGSHRLMLDNVQEDSKVFNVLPKQFVSSSSDSALLFDTSLFHSVIPDPPSQPSIRLIYSFIAKEQLEDSNPEELHKRTSQAYDSLA